MPRQPGDTLLGLVSNPAGFHQHCRMESDLEEEVRRAVVG
jgi:hypothetical protein